MNKIRFIPLLLLAGQFVLGQPSAGDRHYSGSKLEKPPLLEKRHALYLIPNFKKSHAVSPNIFVKDTKDKVFIDFVGTGDIQQAISGGQPLNANTGAGIIFERYAGSSKFFQSQEIEATINIATTADSIRAKFSGDNLLNRRSFGSYILSPQSAKQSIYLNSNLYFGYGTSGALKTIPNILSGINLRFIASNNLWQYNDTVSKNVGAYQFRIGLFHEFLPDNYRLDENFRARFSMFLGLSYSLRGITGDLSSPSNDSLRMKFIGTPKKTFSGIELSAGFRLNNLRLEFDMPVLSSKSAHIDGLTDTQFQFTIRFIGGFGLKINTEAQAEQITNKITSGGDE